MPKLLVEGLVELLTLLKKALVGTVMVRQFFVISSLFSVSFIGLVHGIEDEQGGAPQMPPTQVSVVTVENRLLAPTTTLQGNVVSLNDATISSQVEGLLNWIAQANAKVNKGDVIAKLDDERLQLDLKYAQAHITKLKADLNYRLGEVKRFEQLAKTDNASRAKLQQELALSAMLKQDIVQANVDEKRIKREIRLSHIVAPFSGFIVNRNADVGEFIRTGDALMRLVDTQNIEVSVATPMTLSAFMIQGNQVKVSNAHFTGELALRAVAPVGDSVSRMLDVRLSATSKTLAVGEALTVYMPNGESKTAPSIPRDAIVLKGRQPVVYKIDDASKAELINVDVAVAVDGWIALSQGIEVGDKVIVRGGERLQAGQRVVIKTD